MVTFFFTLFRLVRGIARGLRDPEFRALFIVLIVMLAGGTLFYSNVEGWNVIDALYFSVITLTTVGYGDLHPTTPISKIFTVLYIFIGIGIIMAFIERLATHSLRHGGRRKASAETAEAGEGKDL
ncbi:MAG: potassium channel family protein [Alphaproteobacteria bacterium]|nr:potassium channel family protein [Alphaproteobacteria bacterium]